MLYIFLGISIIVLVCGFLIGNSIAASFFDIIKFMIALYVLICVCLSGFILIAYGIWIL